MRFAQWQLYFKDSRIKHKCENKGLKSFVTDIFDQLKKNKKVKSDQLQLLNNTNGSKTVECNKLLGCRNDCFMKVKKWAQNYKKF